MCIRDRAQNGQMDIDFRCLPAEACDFEEESFHVATACQCFTYFDHAVLAPLLSKLLKPGGSFAILYMAWLPFEDVVAGKSEELILRYNPSWTGCGEVRHPITVPEVYQNYFTVEGQEVFDLALPFTRESWHGRVMTCRGVEASLSKGEIERFDAEHRQLLKSVTPPSFEILHYAAITILKKKEQ